MQKINWMPALIATACATGLELLLSFSELNNVADETMGLLLLLIVPVVVTTLIFSCLLHYQCWQALPPPYRATTPEQAVGFLFIPFFNCYWAFVSFAGLAQGYAKYGKAMGLREIKNVTDLGVTYAILFIISFAFLFLGDFVNAFSMFVAVADLVVFFLFYRAIAANGNRVIQYESSR